MTYGSSLAAAPPVARDRGELRGDVWRALRDAAKLGGSLVGTWAVGLAVRIALPRHLGPAAFGGFQFADAFTSTIFIAASLGIDTYVRKEIATRSEHASDFFGGTFLLRLILSAVVLVAGVVALEAAGRSHDVLRLVVVLGVAQVIFNLNATYAAMLQAVGQVDGLSVWNVASKIVWGAGIAVALAFGWGVVGVAVAMLASEALKAAALALLSRRHVGLRFRIDSAASRAVVRASLPFFTASVAQMIYCKVDVSIMSFLTNDTEVGWYGAAGTLAGMSLLLSPLIGWVLLPLTSRAAARSEDELMLVTRRSMEMILSLAIPASLFLYVAAEPVVALAFGPAFAPAAMSLRLLAPTFVLTYAAMVSASVLVRLERGWAVSWVSMSGMLLSPLLNLWLVPHGLRALGPGGAGVGAGTALVLTELYTAGTMAWLIGRRGIDRRLTVVLARTAAVCVAVLVADHLLAPAGAWRLVADAALYAAGVLGTGAVNARELHGFARGALAGRRHAAAPAAA
ncbi:MAG TPA: oligosaccharide flippase family protein [Gemmatirosa sp.]